MIVVRVELHSAVTGRVTELARVDIANIGGTDRSGDYRCRTFRGRSKEALDKRVIQRESEIVGYARKTRHVWDLVAWALGSMGHPSGPPLRMKHIRRSTHFVSAESLGLEP